MNVVDVEPILGQEQLTVYYMSEDRVDFRELVKDLASEFGTRIEMRQVGGRDEARLTADYEKCGQHCCCKNFLKVLKPISMRSAKTQKATLDPLKISGRCGRLMCCLRYEDETYTDLKKRLPHRKTRVGTPEGPGHRARLEDPRPARPGEARGGRPRDRGPGGGLCAIRTSVRRTLRVEEKTDGSAADGKSKSERQAEHKEISEFRAGRERQVQIDRGRRPRKERRRARSTEEAAVDPNRVPRPAIQWRRRGPRGARAPARRSATPSATTEVRRGRRRDRWRWTGGIDAGGD